MLGGSLPALSLTRLTATSNSHGRIGTAEAFAGRRGSLVRWRGSFPGLGPPAQGRRSHLASGRRSGPAGGRAPFRGYPPFGGSAGILLGRGPRRRCRDDLSLPPG